MRLPRLRFTLRRLMVAVAIAGIVLATLVNLRPMPVPRTIFVPIVQAPGLSMQERLSMTELKIQSIERDSPLKVVGSPERADVIYEWRPGPARLAGASRR